MGNKFYLIALLKGRVVDIQVFATAAMRDKRFEDTKRVLHLPHMQRMVDEIQRHDHIQGL